MTKKKIKKIKLKQYTLSLDPKGEYTFATLPEELCREMCDEIDNGERYAKDSRYHYTTKYFQRTKEGFHIGTAKGAVQYAIMQKLNYRKGRKIKVINDTIITGIQDEKWFYANIKGFGKLSVKINQDKLTVLHSNPTYKNSSHGTKITDEDRETELCDKLVKTIECGVDNIAAETLVDLQIYKLQNDIPRYLESKLKKEAKTLTIELNRLKEAKEKHISQ